jgi:hypothetical protein
MRLNRFAAIALSAAALVAVSAPFAAHAATSRDAAAATAAPSVAVYSCVNKPQVRPGTYYMFCDGSAYFTKLHWSTWNTSTATATGVEYIDNCAPNCAAGKWSHQSVDLIFWRSLPVKGHPGKRGYSQMTVLYPYRAIGNHSTYTQVPPGAFPGEF